MHVANYFKEQMIPLLPDIILHLMLSTLGKIFSRQHFEIFFLFFSENRIRHFLQIVSNGDNLHAMSLPVFWGKIRKNITQFAVCWIIPESGKG